MMVFRLFRLDSIIAVSLAISYAVLPTLAVNHTLMARNTFSGSATFFFQNGVAGACGEVHRDSDHIVALETQTFAKGKHCGATITITDRKTGKIATGVVADECPGCKGHGSVDLSQGLFAEFEPESEGVFPVFWHF